MLSRKETEDIHTFPDRNIIWNEEINQKLITKKFVNPECQKRHSIIYGNGLKW